MSAGLPGLGLGGLFFIFSALLGPVFELVRTARGESSPERRRQTARQFALALLMIATVELTLRGVYVAIDGFALDEGAEGSGVSVLPLAPIAITTVLLALVLTGAKALELVMGWRPRPVLDVLPAGLRRRLLAGSAALVAAWVALLSFGASEYEPLRRDRGGEGPAEPVPAISVASPRPQAADRGPAGSASRGPEPGDSVTGGGPASGDRPAGAGGAPSGEPGGGGSPSGSTPPPSGSGSPPGAGQPPDSGGQPPDSGSPPDSTEPPADPGQSGDPGPPPHSNAPDTAGPPEDPGSGRGGPGG